MLLIELRHQFPAHAPALTMSARDANVGCRSWNQMAQQHAVADEQHDGEHEEIGKGQPRVPSCQ